MINILFFLSLIVLSGCGSPPKIVINPSYGGTVLPTLTNYKQTLTPLDNRAHPLRYYRYADNGFPQKEDNFADLVVNDQNWLKGSAFAFWVNDSEVLLQLNPANFMLINLQSGSQTPLHKDQVMQRQETKSVFRRSYRVLENLTDFSETATVCADFFEDMTVELQNKTGDKAVVLRQHQTYKGKDQYRMVNSPIGFKQYEERYCSAAGWLSRHCYVSDLITRNEADDDIVFDDLEFNEINCPGKSGGFLMSGNDYNLEQGGYLSNDGRYLVGEQYQYDLTSQTQTIRTNGWVAKMQWARGGSGFSPALYLWLALPNSDKTRAFVIFNVMNHPDDNYYYGVLDLRP